MPHIQPHLSHRAPQLLTSSAVRRSNFTHLHCTVPHCCDIAPKAFPPIPPHLLVLPAIMNTPAFTTVAASSFIGTSLTPVVCPRSQRTPPPATARVPARMMADDKPKNPFAGLGMANIMDAMKKAQDFTSVAKDLQDQLKNTEIETTVRDGQVTVIMTAQSVPLKIEVSDDLVAKGAAEVSAAVTEGVVAAHQKTSEYMREKMGNLTKEFGIPSPPK